VRPGIIGEIGASQVWVSPLEERVHRAAAPAQLTTRLPLATHTLYHRTGAQQMRILTIARWDGYVSLDNIGLQHGDHEARVLRLLLELIEGGVAPQILLSQDVGQVPEPRSRGGRGYTYLAERILPALRAAGVDDDVLRVLTIENPRRWLTIAGSGAA
jgi:predicted metal-dependent phosphotriesterase family hydrolase